MNSQDKHLQRAGQHGPQLSTLILKLVDLSLTSLMTQRSFVKRSRDADEGCPDDVVDDAVL